MKQIWKIYMMIMLYFVMFSPFLVTKSWNRMDFDDKNIWNIILYIHLKHNRLSLFHGLIQSQIVYKV